MKLKCLGSGSSGNCYLLENDTECLVIEAGVPFKEVKKALDFNISKIVGVVCTHSHADHSGRAYEYEAVGIPVFKPYESDELRQVRTYGNFVVKSFDVVHDVPCCGFLIMHPDMGRLLYASDTEYIKYRFDRLNHILVEANYSADLIDPNAVNRNHVLTGHMELQTTLDFLRANSNPELRNVTLCHLSDRNAEPKMFAMEARKAVSCPVHVAEKGLVVNVGLVPF
ncbi:MAG: MBL fold metallo-hydrolase [Eubacteriales bacterium]|nr:MBL fold metallo-hydrolase [Eubacteriales bacterium]